MEINALTAFLLLRMMLNHICQQHDSVSVYVVFIYLHLLGPSQGYNSKPGGPLVFSSSRDRVSPWKVGKPSYLKWGCLPKNISLDSLDYLSWTSYLQTIHEFVYCCSVWNKYIRKCLSMSMTTLPVFNSCIRQKRALLQCNLHSDCKWLTGIWKCLWYAAWKETSEWAWHIT
jgi:hypothetical protein